MGIFFIKTPKCDKKRKIELHARSIFLQGLLLSNNKKIDKNGIVIKMKRLLFGLKRLLEQFKLSNICSLCLNYVYSLI